MARRIVWIKWDSKGALMWNMTPESSRQTPYSPHDDHLPGEEGDWGVNRADYCWRGVGGLMDGKANKRGRGRERGQDLVKPRRKLTLVHLLSSPVTQSSRSISLYHCPSLQVCPSVSLSFVSFSRPLSVCVSLTHIHTICLSVCLCLSLSLSVCVSLSVSLCVSLFLSVSLSLSLSLPVCLSVSLSQHTHTHTRHFTYTLLFSVCLFARLSLVLPHYKHGVWLFLSVNLFVYLMIIVCASV